MRKPAQNRKVVANDLKHFQTALERASRNTTRPEAINLRVVTMLSELVRIFQNETLRNISKQMEEREESKTKLRRVV